MACVHYGDRIVKLPNNEVDICLNEVLSISESKAFRLFLRILFRVFFPSPNIKGFSWDHLYFFFSRFVSCDFTPFLCFLWLSFFIFTLRDGKMLRLCL